MTFFSSAVKYFSCDSTLKILKRPTKDTTVVKKRIFSWPTFLYHFFLSLSFSFNCPKFRKSLSLTNHKRLFNYWSPKTCNSYVFLCVLWVVLFVTSIIRKCATENAQSSAFSWQKTVGRLRAPPVKGRYSLKKHIFSHSEIIKISIFFYYSQKNEWKITVDKKKFNVPAKV